MDTSVDKCLAFCQALAMSGQKFSFTLSIGKDNFAFTNKELGPSSCMKKKSPSQIRRELRRKEERSLKKAAEPTEKVVEASESDPIVSTVGFQCSQCDSSFKAEEDLNAHIGEVHSAPVLPTPEKERAPHQVAELLLTPISGEKNEEDTKPSPLQTVSVCHLPLKCGGGAKCIDLDYRGGARDHGMVKCGKSFTTENDLIIHAKNNHNYCLEHDRMWYKCSPCRDNNFKL